TFLMLADGFSKEMDVNSASPDRVGPLPFHRMTRYPYEAPEHYPSTAAHESYRAEYNTRIGSAGPSTTVLSGSAGVLLRRVEAQPKY
ncbi:MAG TPA: hypothetical protein VGY57_14040, partial [Vicinamibacterales bacterium]|nr:hypothetical protein [Vicinamibacterales bacterium]